MHRLRYPVHPRRGQPDLGAGWLALASCSSTKLARSGPLVQLLLHVRQGGWLLVQSDALKGAIPDALKKAFQGLPRQAEGRQVAILEPWGGD